MNHLMREFAWILLSTLCLALLPWWQCVIISAVTAPVLLRLTERGFKRRLVFLFISCMIMLISFHSSRSAVSTAISKLFKLPHFSILAILSAGCFSLVIALAAESVLWAKYSFRKLGQKVNLRTKQKTFARSAPK
ncbi:MAG: hypothetical protein FJY29_00495 [Betaproteobacteria bacterium]|nr:hypothetical protein [Betaproteobacteria bacterium]